MKFSEMPYERPDMSALKEQFAALTERLQNAPDYAAPRRSAMPLPAPLFWRSRC